MGPREDCQQATEFLKSEELKSRNSRYSLKTTIKQGLLDDYLIQQLRNPSLKMVLA
jgi:hypothetical protein